VARAFRSESSASMSALCHKRTWLFGDAWNRDDQSSAKAMMSLPRLNGQATARGGQRVSSWPREGVATSSQPCVAASSRVQDPFALPLSMALM
jgi:hypothetical protein